MPERGWRIRIQDILDSVLKIEQYTAGLGFETFKSRDMVIDAVIRNLEIIGEAARYIPLEIEVRHPEIPWDDMRGMRNVVIHEYFGVDLRIIWQTVTGDLPVLVPLLEDLLESET